MQFNDLSGYLMADVLSSTEIKQWKFSISQQDWELVKDCERTARKRRGGGLPPDDGVFTRSLSC